MKFDDIPAGAAVFLDANIFIYTITADAKYGAACQGLLQRIENKEFRGLTSAHALAEMAHRLMTIEAAALFRRPLTGMANWLKRHPGDVQRLSRFRQAIDEIAAVPIDILPVTGSHVSHATDLCLRHGLLMNDAVAVAVMDDNKLPHLASLDADFDRVPGLTRYAPV
jgi:predicted nucleic acid-binding protein